MSGLLALLDDVAAIAKVAAAKGIERSNLKLGFIKLTDIAPLVVAKEKGFFAEEGLNVTLEPQANWKVLLDGVTAGDLDGAHMLAGQVLAALEGAVRDDDLADALADQGRGGQAAHRAGADDERSDESE